MSRSPRPRVALVCALALGAVAAAAVPATASAARETHTLRFGPLQLAGFHTIFPRSATASPRRSGYVVAMNVRLVDARGRRVPIRDVMLHHVVFLNAGRPGGPPKRSSCEGRNSEPFYGTGEERQRLILPPGYGYRVNARDRWHIRAMLMSHRTSARKVFIEYRVTIETAKRLTGVKPLWLRANGCTKQPSYPVNGGGAPGSIDRRTADWKMPFSGRIVAAGAHLHGSAKALLVSQPRCGDRTLIDQRPRWGRAGDAVYRVRPVLHEPGPIATGYFLSREGIPVRRGERLRVSGLYDAELPHMMVMAITHVYVAPDKAVRRTCAPLPADQRIFWTRRDGRDSVAPTQISLAKLNSRGEPVEFERVEDPEVVAGDSATVDLTKSVIAPPNLSIALNGTITWRFPDRMEHVVLLANGPRALNSGIRSRGESFVRQLTVPGTYNLFCWLHPVTMHQTVTVRPGT